MKKNSFFYDWSVWFLLAVNIYVIIIYQQKELSFKSIAIIYILQSLVIGFFNFINLLIQPVNNPDSVGGAVATRKSIFFMAVFFAIHYGLFHVVYFLFVAGNSFNSEILDWRIIKIFFWLLLVGSLADFIKSKINNRKLFISTYKLFFFPYLRIIPMHAMIMCAFFLPASYQLLFLVLKTIVDIAMHVIYQNILFSAKKNI